VRSVHGCQFVADSLYPAAVGTGAKSPEAAQAFIKFLTTPAAAAVLKTKGLEPG
jgi:ABC-type molybdate transport system substrate-binding protein